MRKFRLIGPIVLGLALLGWLAYRSLIIVPPGLVGSPASSAHPHIPEKSSGAVFTPADVKEMQSAGGLTPREEREVALYAKDLPKYRGLHFTAVSARRPNVAAAAIRSVLPDRLGAIKQSQDALKREPPEVVDKLAAQLGLLLARMAGMDNDAYLKQLDGSYSWRWDNFVHLRSAYRLYLPGKMPPPPSANSSQWLTAFGDLNSSVRNFRHGGEFITGFSTEPTGMIGLLILARATVPWYDPSLTLESYKFSPEQKNYFEGGLGKGDEVLTHWPEDAEPTTGEILRAEVFIVVQTREDDCFPVSFYLFYDGKHNRWWVVHSER